MRFSSASMCALRAVLPLLLMALVAAPPAAAAPDASKAQAKRRYKKGVTEYNLQRFEKAIVEFEEAYSLDPAPVLLFNIGQAHRKLGNDSRALFFFKRFIAESPGAQEAPLVEKWIRELEDAEAARRPSPPPAPTVAAPPVVAPIPLPPPAAAPSAGSVTKASPSEPMPPPVAVDGSTAKQADAPSAWPKIAAWTAGGLAVAALGIGVQQNLKFVDQRREFDESPDDCVEALENRGSENCAAIFQSGERAKKTAIVGYVAGGVLTAASVALFVISARTDGRSETASAALIPRCSLLGMAASCTFSF